MLNALKRYEFPNTIVLWSGGLFSIVTIWNTTDSHLDARQTKQKLPSFTQPK